ncbi:unnamed protein product [Thelazia callipaeda]|uniref:Epimerase domain-containing protein n=1 Tax=Thelazia callipaeda TaxID=103827 RepID=A0A158RBX2_THECL|nr:unnamed protein product [Thelazia callipaeda]
MNSEKQPIDAEAENGNYRVLVTGATGYLAIHCIKQLLEEGYKVRGTVRDLNANEKISPLQKLANSDNLELIRMALEDEPDRWEKAARGCTYVLHIASPCSIKPDRKIIQTAVSGVINVLRGVAQAQCVQKVVITSSSGAINVKFNFYDAPNQLKVITYRCINSNFYFRDWSKLTKCIVGHKNKTKVFMEEDWTNLKWKYLHPYHKSKTLAEQTAWKFMRENPDVSFSLTVLNPTLLVGPLLQNTKGASTTIISRFVDGSMAAYPQMALGLVDVRDAAYAHILAMKEGRSNGQRILITAETLSFAEIAHILRKEFAGQGYSIPRFKAPYLLLWLYAWLDSDALEALPLYGHVDNFDNSKGCQMLNISYRKIEKSLIEMVNNMIERGMIPQKKQYLEEKKRADLVRKKSNTMYPDRVAIVM